MFSKVIGLALATGILASCSHVPTKTCSAVVSHSDTEYDVCTQTGTVQTGDRVAFYKERCSIASRGRPKKCRKEKVGEGSILKVLDEHVATVKLDTAFEVTESITIEAKPSSR